MTTNFLVTKTIKNIFSLTLITWFCKKAERNISKLRPLVDMTKGQKYCVVVEAAGNSDHVYIIFVFFLKKKINI